MNSRCTLMIAAMATLLLFARPPLASGVVGEALPQYQQRYGKPTHEMNVDAQHPGLIFRRPPFVIFAAFEKGRSVGEMIFKNSAMTPVDISNLLRQNGAGVSWRKENITKGKGDDEKMRAQGILDIQIWSRTDGKVFATYLKSATGSGKSQQQMNTLLVGTKRGVSLVTEMAQKGKQFTPKPIPAQ